MVLYCVLYPEAYWRTFCHIRGMHLRMYALLSTYTYGINLKSRHNFQLTSICIFKIMAIGLDVNSQNDAHKYVTAFYMFPASAWDSFCKAHSWLVWNDILLENDDEATDGKPVAVLPLWHTAPLNWTRHKDSYMWKHVDACFWDLKCSKYSLIIVTCQNQTKKTLKIYFLCE